MPLSVFGELSSAEYFFKAGAVRIRPPKAIRFKQGVLSPGAYINNRVLPSHPDEWGAIIELLLFQTEDLVHDYGAVASVASGGVPHGVALAREMGMPHFTVKKEEKTGHGLGGLIDGDAALLDGMRVLLVEDMSSTFESALAAMKTLEAAGARVAHTLILNTWGLPEFHANIVGHSVHALCTGEMIVDYAAQNGMLDEGVERIVRRWLKDPRDESWSKEGWELPQRAGG
jgi:orotate phosphoribosyltransferase